MSNIKQQIIYEFENNHIKKEQTAQIHEVYFKWEYTTLFEICSKPKLLTYIKHKYKKDFNNLTVSFTNQCIDELRLFLKELDIAFWEYINLTKDANLILNMYEELLRTIYAESKHFINNYFIEMILCCNEDIKFEYKGQTFEISNAFVTVFKNLKKTFKKFVLKRLKSINNQYNNIEIIKIMISAYEEQLS